MFGQNDKPQTDDQAAAPAAGNAWAHPGTPLNDDTNTEVVTAPATPAAEETAPSDAAITPTTAPAAPATSADNDLLDKSNPTADDLINIKQQALTQLTPLVGHLDQSPEDKFRTTMMMIQASDNQELVKVAYEAAQKITDEKARAQALLDIVNEINYFTQNNK